jgi:D-arabinose 1-dehydrogenase-like Zn-dependent alcohol dehydrogenase
VHIWDGYFDVGGGRKIPAGLGEKALPLAPGHEMVGHVVAVGPEASGVSVGDARVVYPWIGCGKASCADCSRGDEHICGRGSLGIYVDGGFADHVLVPEPRYLVAYGNLPTVIAGTYACSGLTAYGALKKVGKLGAGEKIMIIGAGGVGMFGVRLAKAVTGAGVIVADTDPTKRAAALENGADAVLDPADKDATKELVKSTGGVTAALDFVGAEPTVRLGTSVLRKGGKLVIVGLFGGTFTMPIPYFPFLSLTVQGSYVGTLADLTELIALGQNGGIGEVPHTVRPLGEATQALADLKAGKVLGRIILQPER